ncbi:MAG TPA: hypothetical protein VGN11_10895 [Candidatus Baltobacteraceae bacterium]|nr:hypothetical protein [Candidatus Baltobacteraceae bacterium]
MNTASQPAVEAAQEEEQPTISLTRLIQVAPSSASFSGWGPKVAGTSLITRWN